MQVRAWGKAGFWFAGTWGRGTRGDFWLTGAGDAVVLVAVADFCVSCGAGFLIDEAVVLVVVAGFWVSCRAGFLIDETVVLMVVAGFWVSC